MSTNSETSNAEPEDYWTVRAADYDRLAKAARELRAACKDRISPGHYAQLYAECRAIDDILTPNGSDQPRPRDKSI